MQQKPTFKKQKPRQDANSRAIARNNGGDMLTPQQQ